jgi:predicted metallo-beta-lactamase superfamily hydrolase
LTIRRSFGRLMAAPPEIGSFDLTVGRLTYSDLSHYRLGDSRARLSRAIPHGRGRLCRVLREALNDLKIA